MLNDAQATHALGVQPVRGLTLPTASTPPIIATATINLEPGEFFTRISGTVLTNPGSPVPARVASLTFSTNKREYGSFGVPTSEKPFEVQGPVYALHGAVAQGDPPLTLTAIGFWKMSVATQASIGSSSSVDD
jgi:hypothetical protein